MNRIATTATQLAVRKWNSQAPRLNSCNELRLIVSLVAGSLLEIYECLALSLEWIRF